ncbi:MAG: hypothetical protein M3198_06535 [Actinomycetota bacterium]|nr:hypothetical protein [Actinomycetota bacterium]
MSVLVPDGFPTSEETVDVSPLPAMRERLVVAPCKGRFVPLPPDALVAEGEWVGAGQKVGEVVNGGEPEPVRSAFNGWLMGMLALPGQPVREGEALFWIWGC